MDIKPRFSVRILAISLLCFLVTSCYSVRFQVHNGVPEMIEEDSEDPQAGQNFREKNMVVTRGLLNGNDFFNIKDCVEGSLHTVQYRNTFGGLLLYVVTFGRKKQVKVRYVCTKEGSSDF